LIELLLKNGFFQQPPNFPEVHFIRDVWKVVLPSTRAKHSINQPLPKNGFSNASPWLYVAYSDFSNTVLVHELETAQL
jgi:hypothetical protein